jgi:CRP-like cAMP-binding protein
MRKVLFLLGQMSDEDIEWMLGVGRKEPISRGRILIEEGRDIDAVYMVLDGTFAVSVAAAGNREINRLSSGEVVGEMSFVDARPPSATVTAVEDSNVFAIPRADLANRLEQDMGFAARFYRALTLFLSDRLRSSVALLGYGDGGELGQIAMEEELNPNVLDSVHLAGSRFDGMLKRLMGT